MEKVVIVGLGYVGLPLACLAAEKGFETFGLDIDSKKIDLLKQGKSPIDDESLHNCVKVHSKKILFSIKASEIIPKVEIVIVCVPTPIDHDNKPDLTPLVKACESITPYLKKNTLVVIESTIFPGTVEDIVKPILDKSKIPYLLAHCPERIDPGNKKYTIRNIPRVVAGTTAEGTKKAADFYKKLIDAQVIELGSVKAAEATKIMENTFRDINIAFINEMAMSFDKAGIDILEVIKGASTKPFAFMPHFPGAGVGGHCIPVDPYYLIEKAKSIGFNHQFLSLAREINNNMPNYTISLLEDMMKKNKEKLEKNIIGVLGIAYKANVDDTRESPAEKIIEILKQKKATVVVFDPHVKKESTVDSLEKTFEKAKYIVLATDHAQFKNIDAQTLKKFKIKGIVDGRNCLDKEKIKAAGILYHGIGRY